MVPTISSLRSQANMAPVITPTATEKKSAPKGTVRAPSEKSCSIISGTGAGYLW